MVPPLPAYAFRRQQALVVRRLQYRIAGGWQGRFGPKRREIFVEIERGAAFQSTLQGVAGQCVAEAGLVHRLEIAPILASRQFLQKIAAQVVGGNQVRILLEIRLDDGPIHQLDVMFQRCRLQIGIERIVLQTAGECTPAVATLAGGRVGLFEGSALRLEGGGIRLCRSRADQHPADERDQQTAPWARCGLRGHENSCWQSGQSVTDAWWTP